MKERQHFLDVLRVAATCAVVMMHTVTGVMDNTDMSLYPMEQKIFLAVKDLASWCVPVFLLISGRLFLDPDREMTPGRMISRYCRRVILALFLFGAPYAWLELAAEAGTFRPRMLVQGVLLVLRGKTWAHMWYLYLIALLYLLTPVIRYCLKRLPPAAVYAFLAVLFAGGSVLPFLRDIMGWRIWTLPDGSIYLFYYLCGYAFGGRRERNARGRRLLACSAAAIAVCMAVSRVAGFSMQTAYQYPFTVLLSLCLFGAEPAGKENGGGEGIKGMWEKASELCFGIYLVHPVFLNFSYKFLHVTPLSFFIGLSLPLFFLGTLLLSGAAAGLLRKIPFLRKYVL